MRRSFTVGCQTPAWALDRVHFALHAPRSEFPRDDCESLVRVRILNDKQAGWRSCAEFSVRPHQAHVSVAVPAPADRSYHESAENQRRLTGELLQLKKQFHW